MCEEFETHQDGSGEPDVLMGQSIVLSEIMTEVLLDNDDPAYQNLLLQQNEERILYKMKTLHVINFYGNSTKNESNHFHKKAK